MTNGDTAPRGTPPPAVELASWSGEVRVTTAPAHLWELMWRLETQPRWLGPGARVKLERDDRWALHDETGLWRVAYPLRIKPASRVRMRIEPAPSWGGGPPTEAVISIRTDQGRTTVSVEEKGVPASRIDEVERFWSGRLDRLRALTQLVNRRRDSLRQAVVVIHGIGEQQPGDTLRNLLKSGVLSSGEDQGVWVKPDRVSGSYELRRVTLEASKARPTTDVFEFYWAHMIRDTTLGQVVTWLRRLLTRWRIPGPLRPVWTLSWAVIILAASIAIATWAGVKWPARWVAASTVVAAVVGVGWRYLGKGLALDFLGDAARYLMPHPANVAHRQAIREAGVDLLIGLHKSGAYDRIILLGHSLGSVIAYDIVTHAWAEMHSTHCRPGSPAFKDIVTVEKSLDLEDSDSAQEIQHAAWQNSRLNTQPWLVTDLVTVGSPLTHAELLMAARPEDFKQAKDDRTLPTCPPKDEIERGSGHRRVTFDRPYEDPLGGKKRTFTMFHHGAPFAVTRWTNLYFKVGRMGTSGDLVGGPIAPHFGPWVRDVELDPPTAWFAHTWYWRNSRRSNLHLDALRDALRLDARFDLREQLNEMPAFALLLEEGPP